jgi:RecB family exonuclease
MLKIRHSEAQTFLRCRKKWEYEWVQGLKPKKPEGKLFEGTIFHKFLEYYYDPKSDHKDFEVNWLWVLEWVNDYLKENYNPILQEFYDVELPTILDNAEQCAREYVEYWGAQDKQFEVLETEWKFELPLDNGLTYTGTIDLIFRYEGKVWISDHKFTKSLSYYSKNVAMDRQISRYLAAVNILKPEWEVAGLMYNLIAKTPPQEPEVLKSGGLSKNKSQKTTYDKYLKKLKETGLLISDNPFDYDEILGILQAKETENGNDFFHRIWETRNPYELENAMQEFIAVAEDTRFVRNELKDNSLQNKIYRNITKDCVWECQYLPICRASMDGSNTQFLENEMFTKGGHG